MRINQRLQSFLSSPFLNDDDLIYSWWTRVKSAPLWAVSPPAILSLLFFEFRPLWCLPSFTHFLSLVADSSEKGDSGTLQQTHRQLTSGYFGATLEQSHPASWSPVGVRMQGWNKPNKLGLKTVSKSSPWHTGINLPPPLSRYSNHYRCSWPALGYFCLGHSDLICDRGSCLSAHMMHHCSLI